MKNYFLMIVAGMLFLASCSSGNFAKRKYTKGKYKAEKSDYKLAKNKNKADDTKYVVQSEKNKNKQSYKKANTKVEKKEVVAKAELREESAIEEKAISSTSISENKTQANTKTIASDNVVDAPVAETNDAEVVEIDESTTSTPGPTPSLAGDILGYIGFALGILGLLFVILGAFVSGGLFWAGFAFALIALGVSIASWVIDGQSMWNLVGVITSAVALAFAIIWLIIVAII